MVDAKLKPYFDALLGHVPPGWLYAGFKIIRKEEKKTSRAAGGEAAEETAPSCRRVRRRTSQQPDGRALGGDRSRRGTTHSALVLLPALRQARRESSPANLVAWEATSKCGRATYFFRLLPPEQAAQLDDPAKAAGAVEAAIRQLNRALVLLNFRREPIYLPDDSLEIQPRFRRYAIACRKIPELRRLRASFLGRAIHTSLPAWKKQVEAFLAKAV